MKITHKSYTWIKWAIHLSALYLSWRMVFDTMVKMSNELQWQIFFGFGAVFVELFAQFDLGLSNAYKKCGNNNKAFWLRFIYFIYIIIFAFLSAVGTFSGKIDKVDQSYYQASFDKQSIMDNIKDCEDDIKTKKEQQKLEFADHGRGPKYNQYEVEIIKLKEDKKNYELSLKEVSTMIIKSEKSTFEVMHERLFFPAGWFMIAFFSALMLLIYTALILTPWNIPVDILESEPSEAVRTLMYEGNKEISSSKELTSEQKEMIDFVMVLWGNSKEELPQRLTPIENTGFPERKSRKYFEYLSNIRAIDKTRGRPSRALWPKRKIINYIENSDLREVV